MAPVPENQPSGLLSNEENSQVFKLLGNRCQTLSTTVVQLYITQAPHHVQWMKKYTGVLCFVKDNIRRNFFFRLFCLRRNVKLWEHEMYNNLEYIEGAPFFHMFEGDECLVAFNFVNMEEARDFRILVNQKVQARKRRKEKRNRQNVQSHTLPPPTTNIDFTGLKKSDPAAKQAKRRRNITKADIGIPKDFKHISHVGWNSNSGFDINTEDEQLKEFFKKAGVTEKQLQDTSTREYIYDFINKNGGREAVIEVIKNSNENNVAPPAVPPRGPTRTHLRNAPPPPVPNKNNNANNVAPQRPKPAMVAPKKPAPIPSMGNAPAAPPPPPPPPPPMNDMVPPPPPPMGPPSPRVDNNNMNSALLESIRNGTTLKPVEDRKSGQEDRKSGPQEDARGDLLSEIRKGCKLKPVDDREVKAPPAQTRGNDLVSALAKALEQRNMVLHSEDDDDKSDDSSGLDEWDD